MDLFSLNWLKMSSAASQSPRWRLHTASLPKIFSFLWNNRRKAESLCVQGLNSAWKVIKSDVKTARCSSDVGVFFLFFLCLLCSLFSSYMPLTVGDKPAEVKWYVLCVIKCLFCAKQSAGVWKKTCSLCFQTRTVRRKGWLFCTPACTSSPSASTCLRCEYIYSSTFLLLFTSAQLDSTGGFQRFLSTCKEATPLFLIPPFKHIFSLRIEKTWLEIPEMQTEESSPSRLCWNSLSVGENKMKPV